MSALPAARRERPWARLVTLGVLACLYAGFHALGGQRDPINALSAESGPLEMASVVLWSGAALASLACALRAQSQRLDWLLGAIVLGVMALRELDFDKRFTDWNIAKPARYWNPEIPADERLIAFVFVVVPLGLVTVTFLWRIRRAFVEAWREGRPWTRDVILWVVMVVASMRLDKGHTLHTRFTEESVETTLALFVALTLLPSWRKTLRGRTPQ